MMDGFTVYPADLRAHANTLDRQAGRIGTAGSAAEEASLGVESFGIIGQVFAIGARIQAGAAKRCIDQLVDSVSRLADSVRDTADLYHDVDAANRAILEEGGGQ